jgi:3-hydroxyacyl-[acyl-carrier-protein] dehydratase
MPPAITELLPHREPFLFLDQIVELGETKLIARRTIRAEEPQFLGHYPGRPIMPGVLLCEAALQAGCYLVAVRGGGAAPAEGTVPVVTRMNDVKFKRMVRPGDTIEIEVEHERTLMGAHYLRGVIRSGGKLAVSLSFAVMLAPEGGT